MSESSLTAERVRELLHYDPLTGVFTRRVRTAQRHQVGDRADFLITGGNSAGYHRVAVDSERYLAHRVAWLYQFGEWPAKFIDHRSGIKSENFISNLRCVETMVNLQNIRVARRSNRSGLLGAHWDEQSGKFRASIVVDHKKHHLGSFDDPALAHAAYVQAKRLMHVGCTI